MLIVLLYKSDVLLKHDEVVVVGNGQLSAMD